MGKEVSDSKYEINPFTGEDHWDSEWTIINYYTRPRGYDGTEIGEVSTDKNFFWDGMDWVYIAGETDLSKFIIK